MDVGGEEVFKNNSDAKNSKHSSKIKINQKGITFCFERRKNVQSGKKQ